MTEPTADNGEKNQAERWSLLLVQAQAGDQAAYRRLLREIQPVVRALVRRKVFDGVLAEDVVQETLLAMHRVRHTFDPRHPFMPWLAAIAHARSVDALRLRGRQALREVHDPAGLDGYADARAANPVEALSVAADVEGLLGRLPGRQRRAVEMVKLQEMSVADAARASDQSVSSLKAVLHRAMVNLRLHKDLCDE